MSRSPSHLRLRAAAVAWLALAAAGALRAQQPPATSARAQAPRDITGYWVSVVTEDWRWRMLTPRKGDFASVPLNAEGRRLAESWDPQKDAAAGHACRAYGAAAIMRVPGRIRISWKDDSTLQLEADAGTQTRRFVFGTLAARGWRVDPRGEIEWVETGRDAPVPPVARSWQGYSRARWDLPSNPEETRREMFFLSGLGTGAEGAGKMMPGRFGSLHVETSRLKAGYLRKNGIPYGEDAALTEDYDFRTEDDGTEWFTVTTVVYDPKYLAAPFVTSSDFRKEPDGSKWRPTACEW
jgi:hypothetical protein